MLMRQLETTGDWFACQSHKRDRYLIEALALNTAFKQSLNVLKLELGVTSALITESELQYELHITIRLVKLVYVDNHSIGLIGE
jgi:hypothetical protein